MNNQRQIIGSCFGDVLRERFGDPSAARSAELPRERIDGREQIARERNRCFSFHECTVVIADAANASSRIAADPSCRINPRPIRPGA
jgi:hypothetical protein